MMTETDISHLLNDAVPGAPRMNDLGTKVRKGYRRRRAATGVAAAAGLVALGVPLGLQLSTIVTPTIDAEPEPPLVNPADSPTQVPTQTPTIDPTTSPVGPIAQLIPEICSDAMGTVTAVGDARIPEGASKIWLCSGDQEPVAPIFGAPEPVIGDFDDIIRTVNEQPLLPLREACGDGESFVWDYLAVLEYPGGERFVVSASSDPCVSVVGDGEGNGRGDASQFFLDVRERFYEQRQNGDYSYVGEDAVCLEANSLMTQSIYDMVGGVACGVEPDSTSRDEGVISKPIPDSVVADIVAEATANAQRAEAHGFPPYTQTIVMSSRFGDPYTLYRMADGSFLLREGIAWMTWMPSEELTTELDALFEGTRTAPFPEDAPPDNVCVNLEAAPTQFPVSDVTHVAACVDGDGQGDFSYLEMTLDRANAFVKEVEADGTVIDADEEPDFTGHWIAVQDWEGRVAQLYVATGGDLVWDTDELMAQGLRMKATPSAETLDWMREVGIDV